MNATSLFANQRINVLFITIVCFLIYLNALFAGVSNLDDAGLFRIIQRGEVTASHLLSAAGGTYYRPLTMLSYLFDNGIWGTNAAAFHLTNLLIHTLNALLVYLLALHCLKPESVTQARPHALVAALLFAVHPICSESVVWISARTDLLCCFFFLLSLLVLSRTALSAPGLFVLLLSTFLCSLCAKESSIVLLAIAPLCFLLQPGKRWNVRATALVSALATAVALYFMLRSGPAGTIDKGVAAVSRTFFELNPLKIMADSLAVTGFYVRKIIWPFPLNLAINTIDKTWYLAVGCTALAVSIPLLFRRHDTRLPLAIILFGLVPPLLAYHASIPWMPIAERYLYVPLTGAALLVAVTIRHAGAAGRLTCFVVILALAVTTNFRVGLWADPVALWADTVAKSPTASAARVIYAFELQESGRFSEAAVQLKHVEQIGYADYLFWKSQARQSLQREDLSGFETHMIKAASKSVAPSEVYSEMAGIMVRESNRHTEQPGLLSKAVGYYEKAWMLDQRANAGLYTAARLSFRLGDKEQSRRLLNLYLANPEMAPHADKARALLHELMSIRQPGFSLSSEMPTGTIDGIACAIEMRLVAA